MGVLWNIDFNGINLLLWHEVSMDVLDLIGENRSKRRWNATGQSAPA